MKRRKDEVETFESIERPNHDPFGYVDDLKRNGQSKRKKNGIRNRRRMSEKRKQGY